MSQMTQDLGAGNYTVTLTGVVKGNAASSVLDQAFSVNQKVTVVPPGCGGNNAP